METLKTLTSTWPGRREPSGRTSSPAAASVAQNSNAWLTLAILIVMLAATALRLHDLGRASLWNDEAASWSMARQPFGLMIQQAKGDNNPPLYDVLLFAVIRLFGDSEATLRLPSALLGIASTFMLYRLGTVLWGRLTGVFAAALLAFSGFSIAHAQEARMYALLCAAATAFGLASVLFLTAPTRWRAVLCGLAGATLLYSHTYGVLDWVAIDAVIAAAMLGRARWIAADARTWILTQVLAALSFVPWVAVVLHQAQHVMLGFWIPFPTPHFLYLTLWMLAGGAPMLACLSLLVLLAFVRLADHRQPAAGRQIPVRPGLELGWQNMLLLSWAVLPFCAEYGVSLLGTPVLYDRYLIGSLPPVLLLAARGLVLLRFNRRVLLAAVLVLIAADARPVYKAFAPDEHEDFRAAVATFAGQYRSSDAVVHTSLGTRNALEYYDRAPVARTVSIARPATDSVDLTGADRAWVFVRADIASSVAPVLERIGAHFQHRQAFRFAGVTLYLYTRA